MLTHQRGSVKPHSKQKNAHNIPKQKSKANSKIRNHLNTNPKLFHKTQSTYAIRRAKSPQPQVPTQEPIEEESSQPELGLKRYKIPRKDFIHHCFNEQIDAFIKPIPLGFSTALPLAGLKLVSSNLNLTLIELVKPLKDGSKVSYSIDSVLTGYGETNRINDHEANPEEILYNLRSQMEEQENALSNRVDTVKEGLRGSLRHRGSIPPNELQSLSIPPKELNIKFVQNEETNEAFLAKLRAEKLPVNETLLRIQYDLAAIKHSFFKVRCQVENPDHSFIITNFIFFTTGRVIVDEMHFFDENTNFKYKLNYADYFTSEKIDLYSLAFTSKFFPHKTRQALLTHLQFAKLKEDADSFQAMKQVLLAPENVYEQIDEFSPITICEQPNGSALFAAGSDDFRLLPNGFFYSKLALSKKQLKERIQSKYPDEVYKKDKAQHETKEKYEALISMLEKDGGDAAEELTIAILTKFREVQAKAKSEQEKQPKN